MSLNFYYCKGDGFHAVIEERNEKYATEYFVYLMNEMLEPEKGIIEKDVVCEPVNIYKYKRRPTPRAADVAGVCANCGFVHTASEYCTGNFHNPPHR